MFSSSVRTTLARTLPAGCNGVNCAVGSDERNCTTCFISRLRGGKIGFGKIIKMIDELVTALKKDQAEDDGKDWCEAKMDKTEGD